MRCSPLGHQAIPLHRRAGGDLLLHRRHPGRASAPCNLLPAQLVPVLVPPGCGETAYALARALLGRGGPLQVSRGSGESWKFLLGTPHRLRLLLQLLLRLLLRLQRTRPLAVAVLVMGSSGSG